MRVYIMTLGVLAPYRGIGIGESHTKLESLHRGNRNDMSFNLNKTFSFAGSKLLLNHVLDMCSKQNVSEIYLHVQTNNEDAIKFYKKFGFDITDTIPDYYINIEPRDVYVVTKSFAQI